MFQKLFTDENFSFLLLHLLLIWFQNLLRQKNVRLEQIHLSVLKQFFSAEWSREKSALTTVTWRAGNARPHHDHTNTNTSTITLTARRKGSRFVQNIKKLTVQRTLELWWKHLLLDVVVVWTCRSKTLLVWISIWTEASTSTRLMETPLNKSQ